MLWENLEPSHPNMYCDIYIDISKGLPEHLMSEVGAQKRYLNSFVDVT
jgi:hypothetical protein